MKQYLAIIFLDTAYSTEPVFLGIFDDYEKAKKRVDLHLDILRTIEEDTHDGAFGWVVEFELNKPGFVKRTLIGTV